MVEELNSTNFNEKISTGDVVVDFSATWCGPCQMLAPVLDELSNEMTDVSFYKVDIDKCADLAAQYNIMSVPAVAVFKHGTLVDILVGFKPKPVLAEEISRPLN